MPERVARLDTFYARIRDLDDPPALHRALVGALADLFGQPSVALCLTDPHRGGYLLQAVAGLPPDLPGTVRLAPEILPAGFAAGQASTTDGGGAAATVIRLPRPPPGLEALGPAVAVPLAAGDRLLGLLLVGRRPDRRPFSRADCALLGLLGVAATAALERADLAFQTQRGRRQLLALNRLGEELSATRDSTAIYRLVYEHLREVLEFDSFFVARYDDERDLLTYPFSTDEGAQYQLDAERVGAGLTSWIFETRQPLVVDDLLQGVAHLQIPYRPAPFGSARRSRSWMGVPMIARRRVIGALSVHAYRPYLYSPEQVQFLSTVANQLAGALENAQLFAKTDTALATRVAELSALEEIARLLNANLDLTRIINLVVARAVENTGAGAGIMALFDPAVQGLRLLGQIGYPDAVLTAYTDRPLPISQGIIGRAIREDRSLLIRDVAADADYIAVLPGVCSQLVVLVRRAGQVLGALSLESTAPDTFQPEHVDFIEHLAEHAAIAVENARRYDRERRQNEALTRRTGEQAAILRISNALQTDLALDEVLAQVVEGVRGSLGFHTAIVSLVEDGPPRCFVRVAAAGLDPVTWETLRARRPSVEEGSRLMDPRFQVSQSYFISHLYNIVQGLDSYHRTSTTPRGAGGWHPDDILLVPLRGKGGELVGSLSVDDPVDGQLPTRATMETLEIFANQAAVAIENARLFAEQQRRLRDVTSLQDFGLRLTANLDLKTVLEEAASSAVRLLNASSSGVQLVEENTAQVRSVRAWTRPGGMIEFGSYTSSVRSGGLTDSVLRSGQGLTVPDTAQDARINPATSAEGIRSLVAVPILVAAQTLGVLFVNGYEPRVFSTHEQQLLQIFANQVAVAIKNARLFEERRVFEARLVADNERMARELVTARATQRQLLPRMPRRLAGLSLHAFCLPAMEVGGDYYDVLPLADGRLALALGDVTGKGTSAVMLMAMIKTALLSQVAADPTPPAVLQALNTLAGDLMQGQLMTFFYALYDPARRELTYANAGHLYPYLRRAAGPLEVLDQGGLPLGARPTLAVAPHTVVLAPGDLLVLYSDGIVEAMNGAGELFSFDRLEAILQAAGPPPSPRALVSTVVAHVRAFAGGAAQDDVTLLVAQAEPFV